jgi:O-antigen ligase
VQLITGFARFWYDFIIGDDWTIAVVVAAALIVLLLLGKATLWWLLPIVVIVALGFSLWRATR